MRTKCVKLLLPFILLGSILSLSIVPYCATEIYNNEVVNDDGIYELEKEQKIYCDATLEDNFRDDSVLVMFNNDTSLKLNTFSKVDFSSVNATSVNDITQYKIDSIKKQCISISREGKKLSASEKVLDNQVFNEDLRKEYSKFHQIVEVKLKNKGKQEVLDAIHELEKREDVLVAEPNYIIQLDSSSTVPNDPGVNSQWAVNKINLPGAWNLTTGSKTVSVAVLDTGIKASHPDLEANIDTSLSKSFIDGYSPLTDEYRHGTHVAGIIGAVGNNNIGIVGTCWKVNLISLRIFDSKGNGSVGNLAAAVNYAQEKGVELINFSGSFFRDRDYRKYCEILKEAINNYDGLFICSAGNQNVDVDSEDPDNSMKRIFPATYTNSNIIAVAATTKDDVLWYDDTIKGSSYGAISIDLAAPGAAIYSTYTGDADNNMDYVNMSGTSMAAPYVTGVAALIKSKYPNLSVSGIKKAMLDSVDKVSGLTNKVKTGGRLNAYEALKAVENCKYTVVYDKNGGLGSNMSGTLVTYGINTKLNKNMYLPTGGNRFIGWYAHRQSDNKWFYSGNSGSGWYSEGSQPAGYSKSLYKDEAVVAHTTSKNGDIVTMYAQWGPSSYTVVFDANGGGGSPYVQNQNIVYGTYVKLNKNTFSKSGYSFSGWTVLRNSDGKSLYTNEGEKRWYIGGSQPDGYDKYIFKDCETVFNLSGVDNDTIRMYAVWEPNAYTIYFNSNGGTGNMNPITGYSDIDVSISQNSFTKSGYLFSGWHIVDDDGYWCVIDEEDGWCEWLDYLPDGYSKKLFNSGECVNYQSDNGCNLNAYAQWINKEDILIGDVNLDGVVNIIDATTIQKYIAELCTLNEIQLYAADVNKDGRVNIDDVTALQKLLV